MLGDGGCFSLWARRGGGCAWWAWEKWGGRAVLGLCIPGFFFCTHARTHPPILQPPSLLSLCLLLCRRQRIAAARQRGGGIQLGAGGGDSLRSSQGVPQSHPAGEGEEEVLGTVPAVWRARERCQERQRGNGFGRPAGCTIRQAPQRAQRAGPRRALSTRLVRFASWLR